MVVKRKLWIYFTLFFFLGVGVGVCGVLLYTRVSLKEEVLKPVSQKEDTKKIFEDSLRDEEKVKITVKHADKSSKDLRSQNEEKDTEQSLNTAEDTIIYVDSVRLKDSTLTLDTIVEAEALSPLVNDPLSETSIEFRFDRLVEDELLFLQEVGSSQIISQELDSLLIHDQSSSRRPLRVEFWKTPLNSVGYQMTKNRILLYGFYDTSVTYIQVRNNSFYLIYKGTAYELHYTEEYRPLNIQVDQ